jgi:hypothetical protein
MASFVLSDYLFQIIMAERGRPIGIVGVEHIDPDGNDFFWRLLLLGLTAKLIIVEHQFSDLKQCMPRSRRRPEHPSLISVSTP